MYVSTIFPRNGAFLVLVTFVRKDNIILLNHQKLRDDQKLSPYLLTKAQT